MSATAELILARLKHKGAIVVDGDWIDRFAGRLLEPDPGLAAPPAREAIQGHEVYLASAVVVALARAKAINRSAVAAALRMVCIDQGFAANPEDSTLVIEEARKATDFLMTAEELAALAALPDSVPVHRGQLAFFDRTPSSAGTLASWTLVEEVAEWYSALSMLDRDRRRGWVLSMTVLKESIRALYLERGEQEVLLDHLELFNRRAVAAIRPGRCGESPAHLAESRLGGAGFVFAAIGWSAA
jgi:hypothetical protein